MCVGGGGGEGGLNEERVLGRDVVYMYMCTTEHSFYYCDCVSVKQVPLFYLYLTCSVHGFTCTCTCTCICMNNICPA